MLRIFIFSGILLLQICFISACYEEVPQTKVRISLVTTRKYPVDSKNCSNSADCRTHNPLVLRPMRETYTEMEQVCCEGYKRENGECVPHCVDCKGGKCLYPDVCRCTSGYSNLQNRTVCIPDCRETCINGECSAPDVCTCLPGFKFINGSQTVCEEATCKTDCTHGRCESNRCVCNFGYERNATLERCVPVCEEPCVNGVCSGPNECTCDAGYQPQLGSTSKCEPQCSGGCANGVCREPEMCACNLGYVNANNNKSEGCVPVCQEKCENAFCSAPNQCSCLPGHVYRNGSRSSCEPSCTQGCENGFCREPGRCECHEGYKQVELHRCTPQCEKECENGYCSAPNVCTCKEGYTYRNGSKTVCEPHCSKGCRNGICTSPEMCTCSEGYQPLLFYYCIPHCSKMCIHGTCTAPETCHCFNGYKPNPDEPHKCEPVCDFDCGHGHCIAPGICNCDKGYAKKWLTGKCEPYCAQKCINSICVGGGVCRCYEGFRLRKDSTNICDPVCLPNCINSNCVEPNTCECWAGYVETKHRNMCIAYCRPACENGKCVAPNQCQCNEGYQVTNISEPHRCQATCKEVCINAECQRPEECVCLEGYRFLTGSRTECEPVCAQSCANGKCIAPNVCACDMGYRSSVNDNGLIECVAYCNDWNCHGGTCSANGECLCAEGLEYNERTGMCVSNGVVEERLIVGKLPVSRWTIGAMSILLLALCILAAILVFRELARRRADDKQNVHLIENPTFGAVMPGSEEDNELNEHDEGQFKVV